MVVLVGPPVSAIRNKPVSAELRDVLMFAATQAVTTMLHQHGDQSAGVGLVMGFMNRFMYRASFATGK